MTAPVEIGSRSDLDRLVASGATVLVAVVSAGDADSVAVVATCGEVLSRHPSVAHARLNLGATPELAALFGIERAPALVLFRAGVGLYAGPASLGPVGLEALLRRALALDMDDVRREMDRERAATAAAHGACPMSRRGEFPQS